MTIDDIINLKCPQCGEGVLRIFWGEPNDNAKTVLFKCFFSATFDLEDTPDNCQKKLDDFKSSGKMEEWLKRGLF